MIHLPFKVEKLELYLQDLVSRNSTIPEYFYMILAIIFWILVFFIFYTYIGYGVFIKIWLWISGEKNEKIPNSVETELILPSLAFIIAAYNEEEVISEKLNNTLDLDYPSDKLRVIVVTDGSTDRTTEIVDRFPGVNLLHLPARKGKVAAVNRAVSASGEVEILVFSDANTILNREALIKLVSHYKDPLIGGVSGEKKVQEPAGSKFKGENLYWRYESWHKKLDASFHTVVGAAGELFSIRKSLYPEIPEYIILDDLFISLKVCEKNYLVMYEPEAFATENPSLSMLDEQKRKVRISAGAFQAMTHFTALLNPFKYGKLSFQYISRRVFRWVICPIALPLIVIINILLVVLEIKPVLVFQLFLGGQILFYLMAISGWILIDHKVGKTKFFYIPFYFSFMNISVWSGFFRFINGGQSAIWEKANRIS